MKHPYRLLGMMVAGAVVLLGACSDESAPLHKNEGFEIPEARRAEVMAAASPYEREMLSDGQLTYAEYERAVFAKLQCVKDHGGSVHGDVMLHGGRIEGDGPDLTSRNRYYYSVVFPADVQTEKITAECTAQFAKVIEFLWAEATSPTQSELNSIHAALRACLHDRTGEAIPEPEDEFRSFTRKDTIADSWRECLFDTSLKFGMPGYAG